MSYVICSQFVDIYAIGLQENCWRCDPKQREQIAKKFMNVLNKAFLRYAKGKLFMASAKLYSALESITVESHYNGPASKGNPPTPFFNKNPVYKDVRLQNANI